MHDRSATPARPAFLDGKAKKLFIGGKWVEAQSGKTFGSVNPATGAALDEVALGDAVDVDLAVAAARRAFEGPWGSMRPVERQKILLRIADLLEAHAEEIALLDTLDMGAPVVISRYLASNVIGDTFRFCAGQAVAIQGETMTPSLPGDVFAYTRKEPIGVVGGIVPWNGPAFNATWKIAPALAAGCTLVLKVAEQASLSPLRMAQLCMEAGLPEGVLNIITGFGETAGARLAAHPDVDKISFTGSTETGQHIIRASAGNIKKLTLELGGKSPDIVFADADLDRAVPAAAMGVFGNSGQACLAGSRLFVERGIYEEFTQRVAEFGKSLTVGDPLDAGTQIGPVVSKEQLDRINGYLAAGASEGAVALAGGVQLTDGKLADGYFIPPTVFANVHDDMTIAREEIFGPVISAIPFDEVDDVIQRANDTPYGLASGVWTNDINKAHKVSSRLRAGTVWINAYSLMDPAVPFGGYKMSGYGKESGTHQVQEYLNSKAVWVQTN
ncbi:aldehyde dehydrogenase family protein (plasmid) [Rhizorhabdus wittichii]|uniref:Aldehyde dehydrogenase family protein n=1 Tax=Rhizorhabdus wittichii TaxID=160791 RepID=A0A975HH03_9SPHN|nr:aldehyde dehydrogenase family protein [Rhizorhabdus wittichii]QTH24988.1 aldehyde dehydrogenase family protein [Rhizorhabdus wittichii]